MLVLATLAATPAFQTRGDLTPEPALRSEAAAAWASLEALYAAQAGGLPAGRPGDILLVRGEALSPSRNGQGRPGRVELRQAAPGVLDSRLRVALRHELVHQLLWWACPQASGDRLFHEALALQLSGELEAWREAPYQSLTHAAAELSRASSVDTPRARAALARVLGETPGFPPALTRRLRQCHDGARWAVDVSVDELAGTEVGAVAGATLVLSRHSGEVLLSEGEVRRAMPFGSTLKPFLAAGSPGAPPVLAPRREVAEWACGERLPSRVDLREALLRSCNGYFLDWDGASLGAWGAVLEAVGLSAKPVDRAEIIGLRATLRLSPWGLAQAYRLLAEARPELVSLLRDNAVRGTLAGLPVSAQLSGVATKTGTVRDAASRPRLGWIVAVDEDVVAVLARPGLMPRDFAQEVPRLLARVRARRPGLGAAQVQVLGLLPPEAPELRCRGAGFALEGGVPRALSLEWGRLSDAVAGGEAVCLGQPWQVRFAQAPQGRDYAGVFSRSPAPPYRLPEGSAALSPSALRARRGSDFIFRTTLLQYAAGVVAAEDAALEGAAHEALARVAAHNAQHAQSRHPGRPVCDTTHCQAFQGTVRVRPEDEVALRAPALRWSRWLPFSQGGTEPWREVRPLSQVQSVLGQGATSLRFAAGRVSWLHTVREGGSTFDAPESRPCELLRSALRLPSCPSTAVLQGAQVLFTGEGRGHGEGLDVEAARASHDDAQHLLEHAYGD
ncbi:SpoIID/LytB domain-containing protein [Simulacricoccus sp. 17bor-14]|nr:MULTISPECIES: SpoIID/LytB domain-containing protein [Myxococcaceae]MBF5046079.1 SpoIID/LytB domain-containing protein [Simulacricoccus sp. 17bor-14]